MLENAQTADVFQLARIDSDCKMADFSITIDTPTAGWEHLRYIDTAWGVDG